MSLAAAATSAPSLARVLPSTPGAAAKVGWAVLGLGKFAGVVLPKFAVSAHSELVALISGSPEKRARIGQQYGVPTASRYDYDDWEKIRDNPNIQVVYVATPVGTHADFALAALKAGKHVLVEKTMAGSSRDARRLISAAAAANRKLAVAYRAWHDPANQLLMQMARSRPLGPLATVMAHKGMVMQLPHTDWRFDPRLSGGGALVDIGIYSVQASRYVTGEEPVEVQATAWSDPSDPRYRKVEQTIAWTSRFPSGVLGSSTASWNYSGQNSIRASFQNGFIELDPATFGAGNRFYVGSRKNNEFTVEEQSMPAVDQLAAQLDHFSSAVLTGTPPMTDGYEGLRDILVIEAIYRSIASGRSERVESATRKG
jgi:glucose-fructose oxidoreductase